MATNQVQQKTQRKANVVRLRELLQQATVYPLSKTDLATLHDHSDLLFDDPAVDCDVPALAELLISELRTAIGVRGPPKDLPRCFYVTQLLGRCFEGNRAEPKARAVDVLVAASTKAQGIIEECYAGSRAFPEAALRLAFAGFVAVGRSAGGDLQTALLHLKESLRTACSAPELFEWYCVGLRKACTAATCSTAIDNGVDVTARLLVHVARTAAFNSEWLTKGTAHALKVLENTAPLLCQAVGQKLCGLLIVDVEKRAAPEKARQLERAITSAACAAIEAQGDEGSVSLLLPFLLAGANSAAPLVALLDAHMAKAIARFPFAGEGPSLPANMDTLLLGLSVATGGSPTPASMARLSPEHRERFGELWVSEGLRCAEAADVARPRPARLPTLPLPPAMNPVGLVAAACIADEAVSGRIVAFLDPLTETLCAALSSVTVEKSNAAPPLATFAHRVLTLVLQLFHYALPDLAPASAVRLGAIAAKLYSAHSLHRFFSKMATQTANLHFKNVLVLMGKLAGRFSMDPTALASAVDHYADTAARLASADDAKDASKANRVVPLTAAFFGTKVLHAVPADMAASKLAPALIAVIGAPVLPHALMQHQIAHDTLALLVKCGHGASLKVFPAYIDVCAPLPTKAGRSERFPHLPSVQVVRRFAQTAREVIPAVERLAVENHGAATVSVGDASLSGELAVEWAVDRLNTVARAFTAIPAPTKHTAELRRHYVTALLGTVLVTGATALQSACRGIERLLLSLPRRQEAQFYYEELAKAVRSSTQHATKKELSEWLLNLRQQLDNPRSRL